MLDLLIKNAKIIDGSGSEAFVGDVGIGGDKILLAFNDASAKKTIDAEGLYISPGFIDAHSHGDQVLGQYPAMLGKINQGITTEIAGQCGGSMFPVSERNLSSAQNLLKIGTLTFPEEMREWTTPEAYFSFIRKVPIIGNMKVLIGHSTLRTAIMGFENRKPTVEELTEMKAQVRKAMECGAAGLSSGLIYCPGCYSDIDELAALAAEVRPYGGFYATHMRNESYDIVGAVREAIEIGRRADVPVWISHHKALGIMNWGKVEETLRLINEANSDGIQVTLDQYPYEANMTNLNICIPPEYFENGVDAMVKALSDKREREIIRGKMMSEERYFDNFYQNAGGFDRILISGCPAVPEADGMTVAAYADKLGIDPFDAYFDLITASGAGANGIFFTISEDDMQKVIQNSNACIGTDGTCRSLEEKTHPRTFATFPKAIRYYHKEKELFTLPEIIHKMTGFTAQRAGLANKGLIKDGYDADLVIFDYEKLRDAADYISPLALCDGIEYVIVNGQIAYHDKSVTGIYAGRIL
jgi:N-acyl-D-amino-acid deacylase